MENTLFLILLKTLFKTDIFEKRTLFIGGAEGNRTPVQKQFLQSVYSLVH